MTAGAAHRARVGRLGEDIALDTLVRHGVRLLDRNVVVGRGEIDLIVRDGRQRVAVEVKTGLDAADDHPVFRFTDTKRSQVADLARRLRVFRIDLVTVRLSRFGARVEWHQRV